MMKIYASGLAALTLGAAPAALAQQGQGYDAGVVQIANFIGNIEIREGGERIVVEARPGAGGQDAASVRLSGGVVAIDGGQSVGRVNCRRRDGEAYIGARGGWFGLGGAQTALSDYPSLVITAPASMGLVIRQSLYQGEAGALGEADLEMRSCAHFRAGDIAGPLTARMSGSGALTAGNVGADADLVLSGSGRVTTGDIAGAADARISGSGAVRTGDISGPSSVTVSGSGGFQAGEIGDLTAVVSGSGSVRASGQTGALTTRISGSGSVRLGSGRADPLRATISGSGSVRHGGEAANADVNISGSGSVRASRFTGETRWRGRGAPPASSAAD
ncbi:hypothetical protein F1654_00295 [Alkalicaulis satelles]|uniref:Putative auto-transporter adhesin head GIN domain-containing protein n=1 Tax=Alkalicaulis satelles TaxID=2609175 RepID=A0A5M6ZI89_9PROT|nr:DUF2807 domain-containing protein [Alkalicaulis satelles]KAA5804489.1 hypothetical protein F1654_00295 [Alkalicaulis satelles]